MFKKHMFVVFGLFMLAMAIQPASASVHQRGHHPRLMHSAAARYLVRRFAARHHRYREAVAIQFATGPSRGTGAETGRASFYGGGRTAAGGRVGGATCAHRTLPFGTRVLVTNLANARQAILTVNDRGPFVRGRIVDVSVIAAGVLGMLHSGTAPVSLRVIGPG